MTCGTHSAQISFSARSSSEMMTSALWVAMASMTEPIEAPRPAKAGVATSRARTKIVRFMSVPRLSGGVLAAVELPAHVGHEDEQVLLVVGEVGAADVGRVRLGARHEADRRIAVDL